MIPTKEQIELLQKNIGKSNHVILGSWLLEAIVSEWEKIRG